MEKKFHLILGTIILLIFWYFIEEIKIWMIMASVIYLIVPDLDFALGEKWHRWFFLHSVIIWTGIYLFLKFTIDIQMVLLIFALFNFAVGIHLLLDMTFFPSGWKGTYTIKFAGSRPFFWFMKKNRGLATTIWLFINFLVSLILLVIEIIIIP